MKKTETVFNMQVEKAKDALDAIIKKSRVHLYKPIQIAEILYHYRVYEDVDLDNVESYRNASKKWRDEITTVLLGRTCSSSAKYQDDLFNETAVPPRYVKILALENQRTDGAIEAYIYSRFVKKHYQLASALSMLNTSDKNNFDIKHFIDSFWSQPGLKRSLDKVYEVIVYSLFSTLVKALDLQVEISVDSSKFDLLGEFSDFADKIMCLNISTPKSKTGARVFRVGVTNAADRGLDMYSNWGPAIQIKHLSLDEELAESIVTSIASDRIVIVCKDAERGIILSLLNQLGWRSRIQSIVTETDLINWYNKALRGKFSNLLGAVLLQTIKNELNKEFPSVECIPEIIRKRQYENIHNKYWTSSD